MPVETPDAPTVGLAPDPGTKPKFLKVLGPGLITGASDDDPSGIATYSQAGAQYGYDLGWTLILTLPLMCAIQEISARIGRVTGRGVAGNLRRYYPNPVVYALVTLLVAANVINLGADLGAMAAALKLLIGGPAGLYVAVLGALCAGLAVIVRYARYVAVLKWLTLFLFAYVGVVLVVKAPWLYVAKHLVWPTIVWKADYLTVVVAILGTTISPYLFFWQAEEEAEEVKADTEAEPLKHAPQQAHDAFKRIRLDTYIGMGFSNAVAMAIMISAAATLNAHGVTQIQTSAQAAEALRPIAGPLVFLVFAMGIIGTGLLAVPVLAGSAAFAVGETLGWRVGLARPFKRAKAFYGVLCLATLIGAALNFTPIDPIRALFWSAVINGVVAVPVMVMMMQLASREAAMGRFTLPMPLKVMGWLATGAMGLASVGMFATAFITK